MHQPGGALNAPTKRRRAYFQYQQVLLLASHVLFVHRSSPCIRTPSRSRFISFVSCKFRRVYFHAFMHLLVSTKCYFFFLKKVLFWIILKMIFNINFEIIRTIHFETFIKTLSCNIIIIFETFTIPFNIIAN